MQRLPAIAAFANAAMLLSVIVVFAFISGGPTLRAWTPAFLVLAGPIPLATAIVVWGLVRHPATASMRWFAGLGGFLLVVSAAITCFAALIALTTISSRDDSTWAFLPSFLALMPVFVVGGLGAACIGRKFLVGAPLGIDDAPNWLAPLGIVAALAGILSYSSMIAVLIASMALVLWWALLGAMLYFYKPSQAEIS